MAKANSKTGEINTASTIFAGGAAGMAYWILGMPADVLKSRLQSGKIFTLIMKVIFVNLVFFCST